MEIISCNSKRISDWRRLEDNVLNKLTGAVDHGIESILQDLHDNF